MWQAFNLRTRIILLLAGLVAIALSSGAVMVWYTYRIEALFTGMIERNMTAFESAASLEVALVNQKGFVTYYFLDNDATWLKQYYEQRRIFQEKMKSAQALVHNEQQLADIQRIADKYGEYTRLKDRVINLYKQGRRDEGVVLHRSVRRLFFDMISLCEDYKLQHLSQIRTAREQVAEGAARLRLITVLTITVQMLLALGLGLLLVHQILVPVYQMLVSTGGESSPNGKTNVVTALGNSINELLLNVDQTHQELEKSRENLLQAEKMAMVGRLAAGMAHSIRNPFTSVKMRLFSLGRSLPLTIDQKEDFDVISQEIRHIDTIVQNFLEFSRPPKLVMQPVSLSAIVDNALQLLSHRLDSYGVTVEVVRSEMLPEVMADTEQLKEVLVNLIINACEEMKTGGSVVISEMVNQSGNGRKAVLYISDSGPGISQANAAKIFTPFFTTKDEGTGLGLSIADRIVTEHGGTLTLDATDTAGATFIISLPVKES